jgi:thiamine biosynthesis lipoprotein
LADPVKDGAAAAESSRDLLRISRPAMGSYFEVRLGASVPGALDLGDRALDLIDALESQLTIYRDDSEVSRINACAHVGPIEVEPGLFGLLEQAVAIGNECDRAYDVTTGALSFAWGFTKGPKRVPTPDVLEDARARTGSHLLRLDPERMTVEFTRQGVVINLGSIGKGYAIDRASALIRDHWWPTSALVHGGRSSLYALGSPPGRIGDRWEVGLRNPFDPERPLGTLRLRNRGMGTSGASFQRFEVDGRVYGHILDPRTGEPGTGAASVTVLAPTAAKADALSTAFYLLGPEGAASYVDKHPEIGALFVLEDPEAYAPRVSTFGITETDFIPAIGRARRYRPRIPGIGATET